MGRTFTEVELAELFRWKPDKIRKWRDVLPIGRSGKGVKLELNTRDVFFILLADELMYHHLTRKVLEHLALDIDYDLVGHGHDYLIRTRKIIRFDDRMESSAWRIRAGLDRIDTAELSSLWLINLVPLKEAAKKLTA